MPNFLPPRPVPPDNDSNSHQFLLPHQIKMINEALCSLGEYGEVRLIVEKGRLRYLVTQKSLDVLKYQPGTSIQET